MASKKQPDPEQPPRLSQRISGLIVLLSVLTIVGLAIADFADDGKVAREWIWALLGIALTFGGYGVDRIFGRRFGP